MADLKHRARSRGPLVLRGLACTLVAALLATLLAACAAGSSSGQAQRPAATVTAALAPAASGGQGCGAATARTVAEAAVLVAERIYGLELDSPEVRSDRRQIEGYAPLLSALAGRERGAVARAVTSLVYAHTHVVRLRVSRKGAVLADVGGPYILAPVSGSLRVRGRIVGHYTFSVQDDLGYVKLEQRFIGAPVLLRRRALRVPVEGTLSSAGLPQSGPVEYRGASYEAVSLDARAFPSGRLTITLLIAGRAASSLPCTAVRSAELDRIGQRIWQRYIHVGAPISAYVDSLRGLTGALAYVRSGSRQLAGGTRPGPAELPVAGTVRYRGVTYSVSSFAARTAAGPVRVYQLLPA